MATMNFYHRLQALNTAEVADALDACSVEGALLNIKPLKSGTRLIGPAYTIEYSLYDEKPQSFQGAADYIDSVPPNSIIVIDNKGREDCTTWGHILTEVALHKNIAGTLVHGAVRDIQSIRASNYPLFCSAVYMRSGKNRVYKSGECCQLTINDVVINPGDFIFADDNGALVIPQNLLDEVIEKAETINATEQKIIAAVKEGSSLSQARKDYRYDKPWISKEK